jgi:hypothetical protein
LSGFAILLASLLIVPTSAMADLGGYLERSATAEFSGEQLIACETPDGARDSLFEIAQSDGWVAAWTGADDDRRVTVGSGKMATVTGDHVVASSVVESSDFGSDSASYTVGEEVPTTFLGREAVEVMIERDGVRRIALTVDVETDAVVRTEVLDADGNVYCDRRLVSFTPGVPGAFDDLEESIDAEPALPIDSAPAELPETTHGFHLLDTYQLDEGTLSYYSDGFFSFGTVVTDRPVGFAESDEVVVVDDGAGEYQRVYEAGRVTVAWRSAAGNLALIGDLPPDLVEDVLTDLPRPVGAGFFETIWSRLFG